MVFIKKHAELFLVLAAIFIASACYIVKRESNYFSHINRITKKFIKQMEKEHGFTCFSIGGSFSGNIKAVDVKFYCYERKSIEEARKLEIDCVEHFRKMINSNRKIRAYLEEFPFPSERVEVMICFCKKYLTSFLPEDSISLVMNARGKVFYDVEFNSQRPDQTLLEETYTDAYVKVKGKAADEKRDILR